MKKIAVLVSGNGTNAQNIADYFSSRDTAQLALIVSDNPQAYALQRAADMVIPAEVVTRSVLRADAGVSLIEVLKRHDIDYVVLAGFLSLVPPSVIEAYRYRIINIHPALLPDYGGKGMYGDRVHSAVIEARESRSGITIHYVDEQYDRGATVAQFSCPVLPDDTPQSLAARIHELEYLHYPRVIEQLIQSEKINEPTNK